MAKPIVHGVKERQILFSAPMIRALLDGSKTQTRRAMKDPWDVCNGEPIYRCGPDGHGFRADKLPPYGQPGERLWVRETFLAYGRWETRHSEKKNRDEWHFIDMTLECDRAYQYAADNPDVPLANGRGVMPGWWTRPAIFMPRAACRILQEIVSVRVERLNDCSNDDALAEGVKASPGGMWSAADGQAGTTPRAAYALLWESINGADSWRENPWVWAIDFKRVTQGTEAA